MPEARGKDSLRNPLMAPDSPNQRRRRDKGSLRNPLLAPNSPNRAAINQIGAFIAGLRAEKGWTQRQLAERVHVTDKAVSKWERGRGYPDISTIPALASALGVSEAELLRGRRSGDKTMDDVNGAIRGTLAYARRARDASRKAMRNRAFGGGVLLVFITANLCRKADVLSHGHMTWSVYAVIAAVYLLLPLATACFSQRNAFCKTLGAGCAGIFPALYIALRIAGLAHIFVPTVLPVALLFVFLILAIALLVSLDVRGNVRGGVFMGGLLVVLDLLSSLLLSALSGAAFPGLLHADILLLAVFLLVLAILPWPDARKGFLAESSYGARFCKSAPPSLKGKRDL